MQLRNLLTVLVALVLAIPPAGAQQAASGPSAIKIAILDGEGATNTIATQTAVAPRVRVLDGNDAPVAGAEVVFQAPAEGPSATFSTYSLTQTLRTNAEGIAAATEYMPNSSGGSFEVKVMASKGDAQASAVIHQINEAPKPPSNRKWLVVGAVAAAAAILIVVAFTHDTIQ